MKLFDISGMSCASCVSHVESAVREVKGVKSVEVNLLTSSMRVEFENEDKSFEVIEAVSKAGYEAKIYDKKLQDDDSLKDNDSEKSPEKLIFNKLKIDFKTKKLLFRFLISSALMIPLMYFSMADEKTFVICLCQAIFSIVILFINRKFFISGTKAIFNMSPNMDTLVAMGSGVSYFFSVYNLVNNNLYNLYFDSSAMIVTLITIGKTLESYSKGKTTDALKSLSKLSPKNAVVLSEDKEIETPIDHVNVGDIVVIKTGCSVPVDGIIIKGNASFNESTLTGESIPCDKSAGMNVYAATLCVSGNVYVRVKKTNDETVFSKIVELVTSASASKAPIAKIADKVSGVFVPAVLLISVITFLCHFISDYIFYGGYSIAVLSEALSYAICVLVISCPCSLGLATPVSIMVGNGIAAKRNILFKNAEALENASKINVCVFDKTGTVTNGTPLVKSILFADEMSENTNFVLTDSEKNYYLSLVYSLEKKSSHPLALSFCRHCEENKIPFIEAADFEDKISFGIQATIDNKIVRGGNEKFIFESLEVQKINNEKIKQACENGETLVYFSVDNRFILAVTFFDSPKSTSCSAIDQLKKMNIEPVLLTGDNEKTAASVAKNIGIEKVFSNVTPEQKAKIIQELSVNSKKVAMVGDGINDAPSLKTAFIGFAVGSGTDVALDAADVVIMKNDLRDVVKAIKISRITKKNIWQNLFWAFFYNAICIPVAAGVFVSSGIVLKPMFGALAMSLSSFCVVMNSLRLNFIKMEKKMKKTIRIDGMMCEHCEAHVKKALESLGMTAVVSHKDGTAIVEAPEEIPPEQITKAVTDAGYQIIEIS